MLCGSDDLLHSRALLLDGRSRVLGEPRNLFRRCRNIPRSACDVLRTCRCRLIQLHDLGSRSAALLGALGDGVQRGTHRSNRLRDLLELADEFLIRTARLMHLLTNAGHLLRDIVRREARTLSELAHLLRDDSKTTSALPRTCSFDRGVEREQIRLLGDAGDRRDDLADFLRALTELFDDLRRLVDRLGDRVHLLGRRASGR